MHLKGILYSDIHVITSAVKSLHNTRKTSIYKNIGQDNYEECGITEQFSNTTRQYGLLYSYSFI